MTATATDNAGRTATATRTCEVIAWDVRGFKAPVAADNITKGGRTVPLEFEIFAGAERTSVADVASFKVWTLICGGAVGSDADLIEDSELTGGKAARRYDTTEGHYIQDQPMPPVSSHRSSASIWPVSSAREPAWRITAP